MIIESCERLGLERSKVLALSAVCSVSVGACMAVLSSGVIGSSGLGLSVLSAVAVFYFVATTPKRILEMASIQQSKEAPSLAAAIATCLEVTGSRGRTVMALSAEEERLSDALREMKRCILLGWGTKQAIERGAVLVSSVSARNSLELLSGQTFPSGLESGSEHEALLRRAELAEETKVPLFIAASFFSPIILILLAVLSHAEDAWSLASIVAIEFLFLDVVLSYTSTDRRKLLG